MAATPAHGERATVASTNPADGSLIERYPLSTPTEIDAALDRAVRAQRRWRPTSMPDRSAALTRLARSSRPAGSSLRPR